MSKLVINDLQVKIEDNQILKGVNLVVNSGEVHAIMGPNGTGKSTLASALMGHPKYEVTSGEAFLDDEDLLEMEVDERARAGLFLAMQYPSEVPGVTNSDFMRQAVRATTGAEMGLIEILTQDHFNNIGCKKICLYQDRFRINQTKDFLKKIKENKSFETKK